MKEEDNTKAAAEDTDTPALSVGPQRVRTGLKLLKTQRGERGRLFKSRPAINGHFALPDRSPLKSDSCCLRRHFRQDGGHAPATALRVLDIISGLYYKLSRPARG